MPYRGMEERDRAENSTDDAVRKINAANKARDERYLNSDEFKAYRGRMVREWEADHAAGKLTERHQGSEESLLETLQVGLDWINNLSQEEKERFDPKISRRRWGLDP